ncbi:MAG TPA: PEP-CTERM sorting domain-containing protein [Albitalea sp.]|uniref:PEP-CTERM sorting domain-containing protein n=1 Tax=Piscinibacter sp. TaxID=1903157 RepID=UPI002ED2C625
MSKRIRSRVAQASTALLIALSAGTASAGLIPLGEVNLTGTGLGAVSTVLTLQGHGDASVETGSVGVDALTNTQFVTGDAKTGQSQTQLRTLGELGVQSASDLRVVFNAVEPGNALDITLTDLVLTIYDAAGQVLFRSGSFADAFIAKTHLGMGKSGFLFGLDAADIAAASPLFSGNFADYRIGLSAEATGFSGGPETFFIMAAPAVTPPVPEPTNVALILAGLATLAFIGLRHRPRRD